MEKISHRIADNISEYMKYDDDKNAVIAYGLIALFQFILIGLSVSLVGIIFGFLPEAIVLFLGVGLLRKCTGGIHAQTFIGCTVISITSISLLAAMCRYLLINTLTPIIAMPAYAVLIGLSFFTAYKKAPVDSPNKPIKREEKIKRLRNQSCFTIAVYGASSILLLYLSINNERYFSLASAIICALVWQSLTLTKPGAVMIRLFEYPFTAVRKNH